MAEQPQTILVVDDSDDVRTLFRAILSSGSYSVITATDGAEGLRLLNRCGPDAVILDISMPNVDGFEFLERRGTDAPNATDVPVIVCSSHPGFREKSFELGASQFLGKTLAPTEMLAEVEETLKAPRKGAAFSRPSGEPEGREKAAQNPRVLEDLRARIANKQTLLDDAVAWVRGYFHADAAMIAFGLEDGVHTVALDGSIGDYAKGTVEPFEDSFFAVATASGEGLSVKDTSKHPYFGTEKGLKKGIGAFAAIPLNTPVGLSLGSLCIIFAQPFRLEERDARILHSFAVRLSESLFDEEPGHNTLFRKRSILRAALHAQILHAEVTALVKHGAGRIVVGLAQYENGITDEVVQAIEASFRERGRFRTAASYYDPNHIAITQSPGQDGRSGPSLALSDELQGLPVPPTAYGEIVISRDTPALTLAMATKKAERELKPQEC